MPGYAGTGMATLLRENRQQFLWQVEKIPAAATNGSASIAVQLERVRSVSYPWGCSFEIYFTDVNGNPSTPGAFEVDIQTADIDQDSHYCTINALNSTASLNAYFVGRVELPNFFAKYVRVYMKSLANSVYVSALVTR